DRRGDGPPALRADRAGPRPVRDGLPRQRRRPAPRAQERDRPRTPPPGPPRAAPAALTAGDGHRPPRTGTRAIGEPRTRARRVAQGDAPRALGARRGLGLRLAEPGLPAARRAPRLHAREGHPRDLVVLLHRASA